MAEVKYKTFDDVYTVFMEICRVDDFFLPRTPEGKYTLLEQALSRYNIYFDNAKQIKFDRYTERFFVGENRKLDLEYNDLQLIANYMKLITLEKINDEFVSTYDVLVDDIGIRNYKSQSDAKANAVMAQKRLIDKLLLKVSEDFDVIDDFGL